MSFVEAAGRRLEYKWAGVARDGAPTLVFMHEGLGSVSLWKDFPADVAAATGCPALVYSRWGHGKSEPIPEPREVGYMHDEALDSLPELLTKLEIRDPILVGHSDGASIALVYTGSEAERRGGPQPLALILEAPHVFVEEISVTSIAQIGEEYRSLGSEMPEKLRRHHADPDGLFRRWNDIWLHPDFLHWNIEQYLSHVRCPILVIQGEDDEYGSRRQVDAIAEQAAGPVEVLMLPECRHSPHRDQRERTLEAMTGFIRRVAAAREASAA